MKSKTLNRRTIIRGLGTALSLPLLEAMQPSTAAAAVGSALLRFGYLFVPNGMHMPDWTPTRKGANFDLRPTMEPLGDIKRKVNVLANLTLDGARAHGDGGGDHARSAAAYLTGAHPKKTDGADIHNGVSIDQVIAQKVGKDTRFASLELGLEGSSQAGSCDSGYSCAYSSNLAWRNSTSPLAKEMDPAAIFDRLFSSGMSETEKKTRGLRKNRRKSVLDFALSDAKRLHSDLGAADRRKLDEYLYAVRDIEKRMTMSEKLEVGANGVPNYARPNGVPKEIDEHCRLMLDMMVLAFQTDSTRVISFMFANEGSQRAHPQVEAPEGHHELSHHGKSADKLAKISRINHFYMQQVAYFLNALDSIREGDATLLDNSLIMYGSGISDGDRHNHDDLPIMLAGSGGGRIKTGRHLEYLRQTPLCNLYVWMMQQAGVEGDSFGDSTNVLGQLG